MNLLIAWKNAEAKYPCSVDHQYVHITVNKSKKVCSVMPMAISYLTERYYDTRPRKEKQFFPPLNIIYLLFMYAPKHFHRVELITIYIIQNFPAFNKEV